VTVPSVLTRGLEKLRADCFELNVDQSVELKSPFALALEVAISIEAEDRSALLPLPIVTPVVDVLSVP
jgi:hypothetical protein